MTDTTPLTEQQLADIEARANAATAGPWGVYESGTLIDVAADLEETGHGYRARRGIARLDEEPLDNDPAHREWTAEEDWTQVQADGAFIAHAREDVDVLVAEVRRLRNELADVHARLNATARLAGRQETKLRTLGAPTSVDVAEVEGAQR